jgi:DNA-directed RNA polymerase subunit M/transcription elongation factor TFIIS
VELPLTEPCPQCGADMEPRKTARRGRTIYECPDCGHQMEVTEAREGQAAGRERGINVDLDDDEEENELKEDDDEEKEEDEEEEEGVI